MLLPTSRLAVILRLLFLRLVVALGVTPLVIVISLATSGTTAVLMLIRPTAIRAMSPKLVSFTACTVIIGMHIAKICNFNLWSILYKHQCIF